MSTKTCLNCGSPTKDHPENGCAPAALALHAHLQLGRPMPSTPVARASSTPLSDELERTRVALGQARTPAYCDALALCRRLEKQLQSIQKKARKPK